MFQCKECDKEITATQAKETYEEFERAMCSDCVNIMLNSGDNVRESTTIDSEATTHIEETVDIPTCLDMKKNTDKPIVPATSTRNVQTVHAYTREQIQTIKNTVAKGATDSELQMFLHVAQTYGLDPFLKEIFYSEKLHTIITSRDGYLKAAQRDPNFIGLQSMAVCENDDFEIDITDNIVKHSFGKGDRGRVIGAWAICHRVGRNPVISYASYEEYNQNTNIWNKYKSAMCCKVAESFALKRQFGISGLVTQEELGEVV